MSNIWQLCRHGKMKPISILSSRCKLMVEVSLCPADRRLLPLTVLRLSSMPLELVLVSYVWYKPTICCVQQSHGTTWLQHGNCSCNTMQKLCKCATLATTAPSKACTPYWILYWYRVYCAKRWAWRVMSLAKYDFLRTYQFSAGLRENGQLYLSN